MLHLILKVFLRFDSCSLLLILEMSTYYSFSLFYSLNGFKNLHPSTGNCHFNLLQFCIMIHLSTSTFVFLQINWIWWGITKCTTYYYNGLLWRWVMFSLWPYAFLLRTWSASLINNCNNLSNLTTYMLHPQPPGIYCILCLHLGCLLVAFLWHCKATKVVLLGMP